MFGHYDPLELIFFSICAVLAIGGALGTILFPNPIRGAMSLLFTIIAIAGMYLQLHAPFLAAIQLIVYAGAVVVLFLFVIMLIGPDSNPPHDGRGVVVRTIGAIAASLFVLQTILVLSHKAVGHLPVAQPGFGSVDAFGALLFTDWLVPFEVSSFLLMVSIIGAVAVARGKQPDPQAEPAKADEPPAAPKELGAATKALKVQTKTGAHA